MFTNSNIQMSSCFAIIGSIESTTREFVNCIRGYVKRLFNFKTEKITKTSRGLKNNPDLSIRKIFVNTIL